MEGQGNHTFHRGKIYGQNAVIISALLGVHGVIIFAAAMDGQRFLHHVVRLPDGAEAGGFGGHYVDAAAVVHGKGGNAGAEELHHGVFYGASCKCLFDDAQCNVLGANAGTRCAGEINANHLGQVNVVGSAQQLLDQLRSALTDCHGAVCAITGVGIGADNHLAASGIPLPHIGVDHGLVGGNKLAAVFLGGRQTEHMVVLVDGAAHCAQAVMTVGEHIGQRKLLEATGTGRLDNSHIGDVVGGHGIELHL